MQKKIPSGNSGGDVLFCLLFVLVDLLEVLVGVHLQLAAGSFITGDDAILMQLQRGNGPCVIHTAFYTVTESSCLVMSADDQQNLLGIADSTNTDGQCGLGHLIGVIVEETGVDDQGILGQRANAGTGGKAGKGLVESDVAIHTGTAQEQVDAAVGSDLVLVALALSLQVSSHAVEDVDILSGDIDVVEEVVVHEVPVALVMLAGQTNVLVHIEGYHILEGDLAGLILLDQALVNTQRRGTGGQTQDEGTLFLVVIDGIGDVLSSPCTHFLVVVLDDQFHIQSHSKINIGSFTDLFYKI